MRDIKFRAWIGGRYEHDVVTHRGEVVRVSEEWVQCLTSQWGERGGATGVACKNTRREFIRIELDEGYYNIAIERIADLATSRRGFNPHGRKRAWKAHDNGAAISRWIFSTSRK